PPPITITRCAFLASDNRSANLTRSSSLQIKAGRLSTPAPPSRFAFERNPQRAYLKSCQSLRKRQYQPEPHRNRAPRLPNTNVQLGLRKGACHESTHAFVRRRQMYQHTIWLTDPCAIVK